MKLLSRLFQNEMILFSLLFQDGKKIVRTRGFVESLKAQLEKAVATPVDGFCFLDITVDLQRDVKQGVPATPPRSLNRRRPVSLDFIHVRGKAQSAPGSTADPHRANIHELVDSKVREILQKKGIIVNRGNVMLCTIMEPYMTPESQQNPKNSLSPG